MNILHISSSDIGGGAARAAYRAHQSLLHIGVRSLMYVQTKYSDDHTVQGPDTNLAKVFAKLRPSLDQRPVRKYPNFGQKFFSPAWFPSTGLIERINTSDADIVHLHWVNGGMLRIEDIRKINKPLAWSMHDMWPYTGGCHYDEHCGRFATKCGKCPILGSEVEHDISEKVFRRKLRTYSNIPPITFVGSSRWISEEARKSVLLKGHEVVVIPNPIDTAVFKPVDRMEARKTLGLPLDKPLVLFGAVNATADPRKGFEHLRNALEMLPEGSVELAIFGSSRPVDPPRMGHPMHYMGRLADDVSLCLLCNAADVSVVPSLQENLSLTIAESLASGTPTVTFDIGGNPDMIDHKRSGYLARPFEDADLSAGIRFVLDHRASGELRECARNSTVERFAPEVIGNRFLKLYKGILSEKGVRSSVEAV